MLETRRQVRAKLSRKSRPVNIGKHQFTLFKVIRLRDFVIHTLQVLVHFDCLQVPSRYHELLVL